MDLVVRKTFITSNNLFGEEKNNSFLFILMKNLAGASACIEHPPLRGRGN